MRVAAASVVAVVCGLALLAPPGRYEVDGVSMAPGLLPGDRVESGWFPALDRLLWPRRHERWILRAPDGSRAIKRVVGLPGETVSMRDGDLAIGGRTVLTPPRILAELASPVPEARIGSGTGDAAAGRWQTIVSMPVVLDDAACAPTERRTLMPVRDVGLAAVIRLQEPPPQASAVRVRVRVDGCVVTWRIKARGRYAVVAGRLDGHLVGMAWPLSGAAGTSQDSRSCLPPQIPAMWDVAQPWPDGISADAADTPPTLALGWDAVGGSVSPAEANRLIEDVAVWRDILHRPAADGRAAWRLGPDEFFVLGDFPSASRDSRHWGPLGRRDCENRAAAAAGKGAGSIKCF